MAKKIHGVINGITNDNKHYMCLVGPVDVYNLPYEEYGNNSVLTLIGDVNVSKYNPNNTPGKNPPKFSNVLVFGDFECSNQFHINIFPEKVGGKFICKNTIKKDKRLINEDTILPKSCEFIDLSYSIDSLDILIDKMPKDTRFLVVQDILIKQKSLQNNEIKLNSAKRFQERYPNIIVTNANGNIILSNVLNDIENQKQDVKQEIVIPKKKPEQKIDKVIEKSNSDLDRKDILSLCRGNDKFFDAYSDDDLYRFISSALKYSDIKTYTRKRGIDTVVCISDESKEKAVSEIKSYIKKHMFKKAEKDIKKIDNIDTVVKTPEKTQNPDKKLEPENIKKYITSPMCKYLQKTLREDRFLPMLEEINAINKSPFDMTRKDCPVEIIIDGKLALAKNIEIKKTRALTQSFEGNHSEDRSRIIWMVTRNEQNEIIIVSHGYVTDHGLKYKRLLDDADKKGKQIFTEKQLKEEKCIDIEELIKSLHGGYTPPIPVLSYNK